MKINDFLDESGEIRPDLFDKEARDIAGEFSKEKISTHQVRKFFDEVKRYKSRLERNESYSRLKPLIIMMKSKAHYAANKKKEMKVFAEFINQAIDKIKTGGEEVEKKKFLAFCLLFEAVYGFADLKNN